MFTFSDELSSRRNAWVVARLQNHPPPMLNTVYRCPSRSKSRNPRPGTQTLGGGSNYHLENLLMERVTDVGVIEF